MHRQGITYNISNSEFALYCNKLDVHLTVIDTIYYYVNVDDLGLAS